MTPNLWIALILFLAAQSFLLLANFLLFAMMGEINGRVPEEQRFSYLGFYPTKYLAIFRVHRQLYPSSRLPLYCKASGAMAIGLMLGFAWQFGFF